VPIVVCAAALALTYLGFSTTTYIVDNYRLRQDESRIRAEIAQLERDRAELTGVRDYLKSDEYIEEVARRTLGLVRPGETLVVVSSTAPEPTPTPPDGTAPAPAGDQPWWKALFGPD
jgi:cell division protein FtsB